MEHNLKKLNFTIVTHVYTTGPSFKLEDYLKDKVNSLVFIGHPFSFSEDTRSFLRVYNKGKLMIDKKFPKWKGSEFIFYLKDLLLTFYWYLKYSTKNDYFIGVNNFNVFAGLLLRLFTDVGRIVFYTIDYVPQRFKNPVLNSIYHWLDRFAILKSHRVWNLSSIMVEEREKRGVDTHHRKKQIVVQIGADISPKLAPINKVKRHRIVFLGHLLRKQGVELLVSAMKDVVRKVPLAHLLIIGGGELEEKLKRDVLRLELEKHVKFTGFVKEFYDVQRLLKDSAIAVAPYVDDSSTYTRYTDPGKPKDYMASGLPVVITKVPQVAWEIQKNKCGFAIDYKKEQLVEALVKLLKNDSLWSSFRRNAFKMAKKYEWKKIFDRAFSQTI